jgi:hypothetical protein
VRPGRAGFGQQVGETGDKQGFVVIGQRDRIHGTDIAPPFITRWYLR